jgi:hypothetical protein
LNQQLPSPGELLAGRKLRGNIPVKQTQQNRDADHIREQFEKRQGTQKAYHDRVASDLPPLMPGQSVTVQDYQTNRWQPATIVSKCVEPRSYIIASPNGNQLRRNRIHIRDVPDPVVLKKHVTFADPVGQETPARGPFSGAGSRDANNVRGSTQPTEKSYTPTHVKPMETRARDVTKMDNRSTQNKSAVKTSDGTKMDNRSTQDQCAYKTRSGREVKKISEI